jgi:hypothetical protein
MMNLTSQNKNWSFKDLNKELLPYIEIDYISLICETGTLSLINNLKEIKPDLRIINLDDIKDTPAKERSKFSPEELVVFKNLTDYDSYTKTTHKKFDLILYSYYNHKTSKQYARIPGSLAHQFVEAAFQEKLYFTSYSVSRIDVKLKVPDFEFKEFHYEHSKLLEFNEIQKFQKIDYCAEAEFAVGYIWKRQHSQFIRTYIAKTSRTGQRNVKTFEFEFKKKSAKFYSNFITSGDLFSFNKNLVLELLYCFQFLHRCAYTEPLFDWVENFLSKVKEKEFPNDSFYLKTKGDKSQEEKEKRVTLKALTSSKNNHVNFKVLLNGLNQSTLLTNDQAMEHMILGYCSNELLKTWNEFSFERKRYLLDTNNWDHENIMRERFKNDELYKIEFELPDLLQFLHLTNRRENKNKVINVFRDKLMNFKVRFQVKEKTYYQQFVYSLMISRKRGVPVKLSLVLHPYVVNDLLNYAILFQEKFLDEYYKLFDKHKNNQKKKGFSFIFSCFLSVLCSYQRQDPEFLINFFKQRCKKNPKNVTKQLNFIYEFIHLCEKQCQVSLGVIQDQEILAPVPFEIYETIFKKTTDCELNKVTFLFTEKKDKIKLLTE